MSFNKGDGAKIKLTFSEPLIGNAAGNEGSFTVSVPEYDYVPGGTISNVVKKVARISNHAGFGASVPLSGGVLAGTRERTGVLSLAALHG
ncbi:MAG: hypothetical protein RR053_06880 [Evtepia sp.]